MIDTYLIPTIFLLKNIENKDFVFKWKDKTINDDDFSIDVEVNGKNYNLIENNGYAIFNVDGLLNMLETLTLTEMIKEVEDNEYLTYRVSDSGKDLLANNRIPVNLKTVALKTYIHSELIDKIKILDSPSGRLYNILGETDTHYLIMLKEVKKDFKNINYEKLIDYNYISFDENNFKSGLYGVSMVDKNYVLSIKDINWNLELNKIISINENIKKEENLFISKREHLYNDFKNLFM